MKRVLILCTGNSCRSQMAESIWNDLAGDRWSAVSAGARPSGYVHPLAIRALQEIDLPTDHLVSKHVGKFSGQSFDLVVTVCDSAFQSCPVWPGATNRQHWPFFDPADATGSDEEKLGVFRSVRDLIRKRIAQYVGEQESVTPTMDAATSTDCQRLVDMALAEDLGDDREMDCTTQSVIPQGAQGSATFTPRERGIVCGLTVCRLVIDWFAGALQFEITAADSEKVAPGQTLATITGNARDILKAERICLNFLGRLSGIATLTSQFVAAIAGTRARVYDTRKTLPGWRRLEKYAVACGGGHNHRMGLFDAILIKDNHLAMLRNVESIDDAEGIAVQRARHWVSENAAKLPNGENTVVQIEVDSLGQLQKALPLSPHIVLLDNMTINDLEQAVALRDECNPEVELEASGGVTLETIGKIARTGVERISIGALTHSAVNLDIGLDWNQG